MYGGMDVQIQGLNMKKFFTSFASIISISVSVMCFGMKVPETLLLYKNHFKSMIIGRAVSGKVAYRGDDAYADPAIPDVGVSMSTNKSIQGEEIPDAPIPGKQTYNITETKICKAGISYDNFCVKNDSSFDLDIEKELNLRPDIHIKKDGTPQVLLYHTHTTEAYMDKNNGFYYDDWYPRTMDMNKNVTQVGERIAQKLKEANIGVIHDTTIHDNPSYNGSYKRSAETIRKNLEQYPSIQVTIDLHRDSIGSNESGKIKPTFIYNDKKAAQIMIIAGYDPDGSMDFPDWEYNLRFAMRLQKSTETLFPGMTRPMYFSDVRYNMNITHGSLLIEVGSDANTINEARYSGELLGESLVGVLNNLTD